MSNHDGIDAPRSESRSVDEDRDPTVDTVADLEDRVEAVVEDLEAQETHLVALRWAAEILAVEHVQKAVRALRQLAETAEADPTSQMDSVDEYKIVADVERIAKDCVEGRE